MLNKDGTKIYNNPALINLPSGSQYPCSLGIFVPVYCYYQQGNSNGFGTPTRIYVTGFTLSSTTVNFRMLFSNPDNANVFPSFTWKAFGGSFSPPNLMGSEMRGIHYLIDAYKIYTTTGYLFTGALSGFPTQSLWQTGTYYRFYTSQENMPVNSYAILMWPLVDATDGTIGDYTFTSSTIGGGGVYDQFYISTATNQLYVYLVQKLTSGFTAATTGNGAWAAFGYITSYYQFGFLRMKHHIINGYNFYLLMTPGYKTYTATISSTYA